MYKVFLSHVNFILYVLYVGCYAVHLLCLCVGAVYLFNVFVLVTHTSCCLRENGQTFDKKIRNK